MPTIQSLATAVPSHVLPQSHARDAARAFFGESIDGIDRYMPIFKHAQIDQRYLVMPPEWFFQGHSFKECNDLFVAAATDLGEQVARRCLDAAGLAPEDVSHLLWVSTTGLANPSPDALLINRLHMNRHTRRTPIWGLGCAGGVAGLSRAYEYTRAFPQERVLLLSVELCSVTFQTGDVTPRNLVAASLFADGAAAVLVEGDAVARAPKATRAPTIIATQSTLWPNTTEIMGWNIIDTGMEVVFSSRIPGMVQDLMHTTVAAFLAQHDLTPEDISHWVLHPGGAKVIQAYQRSLGIDPERLQHTREVLRCYGNMSSATVFFVLEQFLKQQQPQPGEYGLLAVLGPGFSCELALIRG